MKTGSTHPLIAAVSGRAVCALAGTAATLLLLAACASPSPEFRGGITNTVTRDGRTFEVFRQGTQAQVIRMGYAGRGARSGMVALMISVIEEGTGCTAVPGTIEGDTGVLRARIRCRKGG